MNPKSLTEPVNDENDEVRMTRVARCEAAETDYALKAADKLRAEVTPCPA